MKKAVIVISAHLKLQSLQKYVNEVKLCDKVVFVTSQQLYPNEIIILSSIFGCIEIVCFADLMTDEEGEMCDSKCFEPFLQSGRTDYKYMSDYFRSLTIMKNQLLVDKVEAKYHPSVKIVASDDLGIELKVWIERGYKKIDCEYYFEENPPSSCGVLSKLFSKDILKRIKAVARHYKINYPENVYVSTYRGKKMLFYGHPERVAYRMSVVFKKSKTEALRAWIVKILFFLFKININKDVVNLTSLHEYGNHSYFDIIDSPSFNNVLIQDGYLPSNDTTRYLYFYGKYSHYYSWDRLGNMLFDYYKLPVEIMPFRKNYALPMPRFNKVKKVLCVSSGAGDWTAIKNRSDDERVVVLLGELAKKYPEISFVLRCHPSWVSPAIQGVNSISRVVDYIQSLGVSNYVVSSNIPSITDSNGEFVCSHSRNSFEKDLQDVDLVLGVHSVAQIDAALKSIPFATVNLSGRRNLFKSISDLGFPYCEDFASVDRLINSIENNDFQEKYTKAVFNYNKIIEMN